MQTAVNQTVEQESCVPSKTQVHRRALIIACGHEDAAADDYCSPMAPLVDRPFLQHLVECIVDEGIHEIDLVLHDQPGKIENWFGDGTSWGATFTYHWVRDPEHALGAIQRLELDDQSLVLVASADTIHETLECPLSPSCSSEAAVYRCADDTLSPATFWIRAHRLKELATLGSEELNEYLRCLRALGKVEEINVNPPLVVKRYIDVLRSQERVMNGEFPRLMRFGRQVEPGIWIKRNVYLHPSVKFIAPVFIGPNCQIDERVTVGPNVVISQGCYIHAKCQLENTTLYPNSLVGEGLSVENCVIDRSLLFHAGHGVAISVNDEMLIGNAGDVFFRPGWLRRIVTRLVSIGILAVTWPLILLVCGLAKIFQVEVEVNEYVELPTDVDPAQWKTFQVKRFVNYGNRNWKHFWLELLPGLVHVATGKLDLIGVTPMTRAALKSLPAEWRELYVKNRPGLITESVVAYGPQAAHDDVQAADLCFSTASATLRRVRLVIAYGLSLIFGRRNRQMADHQAWHMLRNQFEQDLN